MDNTVSAGAFGVAVQDVEQALVDDFAVSGAGIPSNGLEIALTRSDLTLTWPAGFTTGVLKVRDTFDDSTAWAAFGGAPKTDSDHVIIHTTLGAGMRFFSLLPP